MTEEKKQRVIDPEIETTKFINLLDESFTFHINKRPMELKPKEEKAYPVWVAQVGAKHLVDLILQRKGIKDSNRDTPERKSLFAEILPDLAQELEIKPLTKAEFDEQLSKTLAKQDEFIKGLTAKEQKRDEEIESLKEEIEKLKADSKKKAGRPKKVEEEAKKEEPVSVN